MHDIVDKLQDCHVCSPAQNSCRNSAVMEQAAQEIKRLRIALERVRKKADEGTRVGEEPLWALYDVEEIAVEAGDPAQTEADNE